MPQVHSSAEKNDFDRIHPENLGRSIEGINDAYSCHQFTLGNFQQINIWPGP